MSKQGWLKKSLENASKEVESRPRYLRNLRVNISQSAKSTTRRQHKQVTSPKTVKSNN